MPTHDCDGASCGSIMTALIFTCPKSGRPIESGIEADRASLSNAQSVRIRVRCPHCWQEHDRMIRDDGHLSGGHTRHLAKPSGIEEAAGRSPLARPSPIHNPSKPSVTAIAVTITTASRTKRNSRTAFGESRSSTHLPLSDQPRGNVRCARWREWNDDAHRPRRIGLCPCEA